MNKTRLKKLKNEARALIRKRSSIQRQKINPSANARFGKKQGWAMSL